MSDPFRLAAGPLSGLPGQPGQPGLIGEIQSEVPVEAAPLLIFVLRHIRVIVGLVLVFVLAIVGYGIWQWQAEKNLAAARMELGQILGRQGQERVTALEAFLPKAPEALRLGVLLQLGASAVDVDDLDRAAAAYRQVSSADPDGAIGYAATAELAGVLQRQGKAAEALPLFESLAARAPEAMKMYARSELALAAEMAGDLNKAIAAHEELAAAATGRTRMEQDYRLAKIKELKARVAAKPAS